MKLYLFLLLFGAPAVLDAQDALSADSLAPLLGDETSVDIESDGLAGDGIDIYRTALRLQQTRGHWQIEAGYAFTTHSVDYSDPTGFTQDRHLHTQTNEGSLTLSRRFGEKVEVSLSGSVYDGFADYRSVWLSEYYRQNAGFLYPDEGYENTDPGGYSISLGATWDLNPGVTRLTASLGYSSNDIAPGWFFNPDTGLADSSDPQLDTFSASVAWEQAINGRTRNQLSLRFSQITDRRLRIQLRETIAYALTDRIVLRGEAGYSEERPDFQSYYGGLTFSYEITPQWQVSLAGRFYHDSGEVVAGNFNSAAPEVDTRELSASLYWQGLSTSARISVGLFSSDFGTVDIVNRPFEALYSDRDQLATRIAVTHTF